MMKRSIDPSQLVADAGPTIPCNLSSARLASSIVEMIAALEGGTYPPLVGIAGSQGSGKSTLAALVAFALREYRDKSVAILSLDDFYLTRAARAELARTIHPLCATRGVPGTHDMTLLAATLSDLLNAREDGSAAIPRFDKLRDDRIEASGWENFVGRPDCVLLEGWCVGLPANLVAPWQGPINALELAEDPEGVWVRWSIECLARDYGLVWKAMDRLVAVRLAGIESVVASRLLQERRLVENGGPSASGMDEAQVRRFVAHYERFTLALWDALPGIADITALRDDAFEFRPVG